MNKLILIGNGFDLAHGLKTSYTDFFLWYINNAHKKFYEDMKFEDDLIKISNPFCVENRIREFKSINDFIKIRDSHNDLNINYRHNFFRELLEHTSELNWVDIEHQYYQYVLNYYQWKKEDISPLDPQIHSKNIKGLNVCFEAIKNKLIEYLSTIGTTDKHNEKIEENFEKYISKIDQGEHNNKLFLNFNYTTTIENYWHLFNTPVGKEGKRDTKIINIHGKLNDENNPIIFGYGDEMDSNYNDIENLNKNEYLKYIKSFNYFNTGNYQALSRFIEAEDFKVFIFGHSCGISDRILLNSIFEHENCKSIRIFYYKKDESYNDYFEKTQEISRHFKAENKNRMRTLIVPFDQSCPIS